jgi:large subunit ribosomal protein L17
MRHRKAGRKFGRPADQRRALTRGQVTALLKYGRITTTEAKAKELRRWVERVITAAKPGDVSAHRQVALVVTDREATLKLFGTYVERYRTRPGGYTRVTKIGPRHGDAAPMAVIELVEAATPAPAAAAPTTPRRTRAKA